MKKLIKFDENANSCLATCNLLKLISRQPTRFSKNEEILGALKSQNALARLRLSFEDGGIHNTKTPMSINTLKAHADILLERGFKDLDALRMAASRAIENLERKNKNSTTKRTKSGLARLVIDLEEQLQKQQRTNMLLLQGLNIAIHELRNIRGNLDSALLEKRASDAAQTLIALLSLSPPSLHTLAPFAGDDRIARIEEYRK